jgi:hypothetical protein
VHPDAGFQQANESEASNDANQGEAQASDLNREENSAGDSNSQGQPNAEVEEPVQSVAPKRKKRKSAKTDQ